MQDKSTRRHPSAPDKPTNERAAIRFSLPFLPLLFFSLFIGVPVIFAQCAAGPVGIVLKLSTRRTISRRLAWMDKRRDRRSLAADADAVTCMRAYPISLSLSLSSSPLDSSNVPRVRRCDCGV